MKPRILIIDDDQSVRESLKRVLEENAYAVEMVGNTEEAHRVFQPGEFDLVLLDLNLPFESGWELFEYLTRLEPSIPVAIVTGLPNQREMALAAGAGALVEKPVEVPLLLETIEALLKEPQESRLLRLCGYKQDTRYIWPADVSKRRRRLAAVSTSRNAARLAERTLKLSDHLELKKKL